MKLHPVLWVAAALLLPIGGVVIAKSSLHSSAALAESAATRSSWVAQNEPVPDGKMPASPMPDGKMHGRGKGGRSLEQLNLTPAQQTQIKTIRDQEKSASEGLFQQMKTAHEKMRSLMATNTNASQLRQQHEQLQSLENQLGDRHFETMLKIQEVLTPEQRTKAAELERQHHERRPGGRPEAGAMPENPA